MSKEINWEGGFWLIKNLLSRVNKICRILIVLLHAYFSKVITWDICFRKDSLSDDTWQGQFMRKTYKKVKGFQLFHQIKKIHQIWPYFLQEGYRFITLKRKCRYMGKWLKSASKIPICVSQLDQNAMEMEIYLSNSICFKCLYIFSK